MTFQSRGVLGLIFVLFSFGFGMPSALAWGPLGHRLVAETAALLLAGSPHGSPGQIWGDLLARHRFELGYYANLPDSLFRSSDGNEGKTEALTHFFDLDLVLGSSPVPEATELNKLKKGVAELPLSYTLARVKIIDTLGAKQATLVGSGPWRIEQLEQLAAQDLAGLKTLSGGYQKGLTSSGDIHRVFNALYELGVLSHYSGDALVPFHASSDWNGWNEGQGGIHFYFESDCVNALEPALASPVLNLAKSRQATWLKKWGADQNANLVHTVLSAMLDGMMVIKEVEKIDQLQVLIQSNPPGSHLSAARKPPTSACKAFKPLLTQQLAQAAVLTAYVWKKALPEQAGPVGVELLQFSDFYTHPEYISPIFMTQTQKSPTP